jgi:hypothetical protein
MLKGDGHILSFSRLSIVDCPSVLSNVYFMQLQIIFLNLIVELQSQHTTRSDQLPNSTAAQHKLPEYVHLLIGTLFDVPPLQNIG